MKILNLYAGIGGNRKLWSDEHEITAVELNEKIAEIYKQNFPNDNLIIGDAHQYLLDHFKEFDFIWSSPPCQSHSRMVKATRHKIRKYPDMSLYQEIIFLQHFFSGKWIIENVKPYYEPFILPSIKLDRHLFWSNFSITRFKHKNIPNFIDAKYDDILNWLGFDFKEKIYYGKNHCPAQILRNAVHPDLGLHILNCALGKFEDKKQIQLKLF